MEKQFVTYKIALELKKLGFNEKCFAHYITSEGWKLDCTEGSLCYKDKPSNVQDEYSVLAPLWQQVIDWFREKKGIYIEITSWTTTDIMFDVSVKRVVDYNWKELFEDYYWTNDYSEARDQAILRAVEVCQK